MTDLAIVDYRRKDQNRSIWVPYWITSAEIDQADCEDLCALVFSFPAAKYGTSRILIEKVAFQVTQAFATGTITVNVGSWTLATDTVTTAGVATLVDEDEYIPTANITNGSLGTYFASTGDWITAKLLMTELTPVIIVPADTTVPCVGVTVASSTLATTGKGRVHMLITEVPIV